MINKILHSLKKQFLDLQSYANEVVNLITETIESNLIVFNTYCFSWKKDSIKYFKIFISKIHSFYCIICSIWYIKSRKFYHLYAYCTVNKLNYLFANLTFCRTFFKIWLLISNNKICFSYYSLYYVNISNCFQDL